MAISSPAASYVLGGTGREHERLSRQARIFNPFTERLFRNAGISRGQRVLDIGSGVGDVAMLVAELVGPTGGRDRTEREASRTTQGGGTHRRAGGSAVERGRPRNDPSLSGNQDRGRNDSY